MDLRPRVNGAAVFGMPRKIAPAYRRILMKVKPALHQLKELSEKKNLSDEERMMIPAQLGALATLVFSLAKIEIAGINERNEGNPLVKRSASFHREFGHEPAGLPYQPSLFGVDCFSNAMLHNIVFSALGPSCVGVLWGRSHCAATVKIAGSTYVLDSAILPTGVLLNGSGRVAPTVSQYFRMLREAYHKPETETGKLVRLNYRFDPDGFEAALRQTSYLGGEDAGRAGFYHNLGIAAQMSGDNASAERYIRKSVTIQPNVWVSQLNLARLLNRRFKHQEALIHAQKSIELKLNSPAGWTELGWALAGVGREKEGLEKIQMASKLAPHNPAIKRDIVWLQAFIERRERGSRPARKKN